MLEVKKLTAVAGDKKILDDFNLSIMVQENLHYQRLLWEVMNIT